jgi:hypothetical protein
MASLDVLLADKVAIATEASSGIGDGGAIGHIFTPSAVKRVQISLSTPRRRRWERKNDADRKQEPEDCRHGSHRPGRIAPR